MRLLWGDGEVAVDAGILAEPLLALGLRPGHRVAVPGPNSPLHVQLHAAAEREGWTVVSGGDADAEVGPDGSVRLLHPLGDATPGPAFIVHTSGTEGRPKPVAITRSMLAAHAAAANERLGDGAGSVWLGALPLHRIGGIAMADRVRRNGGTLALAQRLDAAALDGITHVSMVPTMLRRLLPAAPPQSLRCLLLGGDHAPESLVRPALEQGWPIFCTYGMTESCSQAATATPQERLERPGTSGRPLRCVGVSVDNGELVLSGPTVAGGGPLCTGDLGRVEDGQVFVTGRRDDRITTGGVKVDPEPVEDALLRHPAVAAACAVGLPDAEWGQRVAAAVVLREGSASPDLRAWCKSLLPAAAVPKEVRVVGSLPRTESGKLRRAAVRALLLQGTVPT